MIFSKKMVYSTLAAIGLMGSAGGIVGGVVTNNNLQTSQTIANLNSQINNKNLYNSSTIAKTSNQTNTNSNTLSQTNSNVDTSNADSYNQLFLDDLNNNKYPQDVNYTRTFSQKNDVDSQYNTSISDVDASLNNSGNLTTNSVLNTKKDATEISNELNGSTKSNLYNTLKNAMADFRNGWIKELTTNVNNLMQTYNNNFYITALSPVGQWGGCDWYNINSLLGCPGLKNFNLYDTFETKDPNSNDLGTVSVKLSPGSKSYYWQDFPSIGNIIPNIIKYENEKNNVTIIKFPGKIESENTENSLSGSYNSTTINYSIENFTNNINDVKNFVNDAKSDNNTPSFFSTDILPFINFSYPNVSWIAFNTNFLNDNKSNLSSDFNNLFATKSIIYNFQTLNPNNYFNSDDYNKDMSIYNDYKLSSMPLYQKFNFGLDLYKNSTEKINSTGNYQNENLEIDALYNYDLDSGGSINYYFNWINNWDDSGIDSNSYHYSDNDTNHFTILSPNSSSITYYNFEPTGNSANNVINILNNSISTKSSIDNNNSALTTTLRTFPNNTDMSFFRDNGHCGYDYYRDLLEWTLQKAPIYSLNTDTYGLNVNNSSILNSSGDIDTNSIGYKQLFVSNPSLETQNYLWIDGNTLSNEEINPNQTSFSDYYQQRSKDEQNILNLYKNPQLKNIVEQINSDKNNFTVSNLSGSDGVQIVDGSSTSGKNYNDSQVFGTNTPFTISKITLPQQFNTNYGAFTTTVNGTNGTNTTYLFNNFLPVLASQIVVDPTSALSSYTNPNSTSGIYTNQLDNTNGELKFKLSENFGQLLSIANIYSTYKNLIEGLNPSDYGLENSQNYNAINNLKNNFENLNFTNNQTSLLNDLQSNIGDKDKVISDANELNNDVINYNNQINLLNLISKIFNCNTNILIDANGNLTNDVKQTLILLPIATKDAMSNLDIVANVSYGDGKSIVSNNTSLEAPDKDGIMIWNASDANNKNQGTFEPINIDDAFNNTTNYNLTGNNDAEINVSNIHFEYKDGSTIKDTNDAYTDNMNFINNGANNNLDYMLNEYNSYYPNNSSLSVNDATNTLTYKLHYNPSYADYGLSNPDQYINTQGIPITNKTDANGYFASDNINTSIIDSSIQNFFKAQITTKAELTINATSTKVIKTMSDVDATYKTTIEQITNNNMAPNDTTGNFYAIVTITNSQNFSNPTGNGNVNNQISMDDGTLVPMWYLGENANNTQQRTYLVEMNASKKDVNLSQISFESGVSGDNTITWNMVNSSNYYYNDGANSSAINLDANGNIEQNQTITINSTNYISWTNNIDCSNTSSASYLNFKSTLSMWFYTNYQKTVNSYTIDDLGNNNYKINVILNM